MFCFKPNKISLFLNISLSCELIYFILELLIVLPPKPTILSWWLKIGNVILSLNLPKKLSFLQHILWRENVYLVPRDNGDLIIGATEEEMGFDKNLTAGGVYNLLKIARDILPAIEDLQIVESWSGLRPTTRDEAPIIGPSKKIKGLIYATGHHRNGILLAPLTSNVIQNYYLKGKIENDFNNLKPGRFII